MAPFFPFQNKVMFVRFITEITFLRFLASQFWLLKCFLVFLVLYLHAFLELDHERELSEDGQMSLFRHGQLWRL